MLLWLQKGLALTRLRVNGAFSVWYLKDVCYDKKQTKNHVHRDPTFSQAFDTLIATDILVVSLKEKK